MCIGDEMSKNWDVFISHASEDKETFVRPLAIALRNIGVSVWYDEFSLRLGDSLSRSIDKGLANSRFGLVVVSPAFLKKPWPEYELRGLVAREIEEDRVILPIWHGVTRQEILAFSPSLADKVALNTNDLTAEEVAIQLIREIRPDIYARHRRVELQQLASGESVDSTSASTVLNQYGFTRTGATGFDVVAVPLVQETLKSIYGAATQYKW